MKARQRVPAESPLLHPHDVTIKQQQPKLHDSGNVLERRCQTPLSLRGSLDSPSQKASPDIDHLRGLQGVHHASAQPISGPRLDRLLEMLGSALNKEIGQARESLPKKVFLRKCKIFFCIGINNVTRTLERMALKSDRKAFPNPLVTGNERVQTTEASCNQKVTRVAKHDDSLNSLRKSPCLQAVIIASDAHPRLLVNHLPDLAASRNVPLLTISGGNGTGSIRLGEIFAVRTAIAIGVKTGDSAINRTIQAFLEEAA